MNAWNKYGTISSEGLIDARFSTREVHYPSAYEIYNKEPVGTKRYLRATVFVYDGEPCVYVDNVFVGRLPNTWTQFVNQAKQRVINATVQIDWMENDEQFRMIVDIEEVPSS